MIAQDPPTSLEQQARSLNIEDRFRFTGMIERDAVARYVAAFDIALQPAVVAYASSLKLFEYLALGKVIVGPAQPNLREILVHEHNALLFDPDDADGLARVIAHLSEDADLRSRIARNARATIADQKLTWHENALHVTALFVWLLKAR